MSIGELTTISALFATVQEGAEMGVPGMPGATNGTAPVGATGATPAQQPASGGSPMQLFLPFVLVMIFLIMFTSMSGRKEKKRRAAMLTDLQRQDKVQTVGGIIGIITEMKGDEVVLRVDEGSNTKIRFARSSIQQVLRQGKAPREDDADSEIEEEALEPDAAVV